MSFCARAGWRRWMEPVVADGAILVGDELILDVGSRGELRSRHSDAEVRDLGDAVVLPGLVNAHTHLELSDCQCGPPPVGGFANWLVGMLRRTRIPPEEMERAVTRAIGIGVEQSLRFGVTTIGDISRQCHLTRTLLRESGAPRRKLWRSSRDGPAARSAGRTACHCGR